MRGCKFEATPLCKLSQNFYYLMFGGRRYQKDRCEVGWGTKTKGSTRLGSMAEEIVMRRAERRREVPDEALSDTAVADVRSSMAKRLTTEQQTHLAGLTKLADKKKQQLADDADPDNETRK